MPHDPRVLLEALAENLEPDLVLARFPGLTRAELRQAIRDAAARLPRSEGRSREAAPPRAARALPKDLIVYIDGAARGNPGPAGAGVLIQDQWGAPVEELYDYLGEATNNTAEYQALLLALRRAREAGAARVRVYSDSELLVNQVNGRYKARQPHLQGFLQEAIRLMREIGRVDVAHVRRELNAAADGLANRAVDERRGSSGAAGGAPGPGAIRA